MTAEQLTELGLDGEAPGTYAVSHDQGTLYLDPVVLDEINDRTDTYVEDPDIDNGIDSMLSTTTLTTEVYDALMDGWYGANNMDP